MKIENPRLSLSGSSSVYQDKYKYNMYRKMTRLKSAYSRPNFVRHIGRKITEKNNFSKTVEP